MHALLESHCMPIHRLMTSKFFVSLLQHLPVLQILGRPEQFHTKPTPTDDMQTGRGRIRIDVLYPHCSLCIIPVPSAPGLDHLFGLPDTFFPYQGITLLIEAPTADLAVIAPSGTFRRKDIGAKLFDDAVVLNRLDPVGAAGGNLLDNGGRGVGHVDAPRGNDKEGIAVAGEE